VLHYSLNTEGLAMVMDVGVKVWMARIMKKYVVEPAEMWWPGTLGLSLSLQVN